MKKIRIFLLASIVTVFLTYVGLYLTAMSTGLPGRKGGPQDAFRHTFSSALVARYISPRMVLFVTAISERNKNSLFDSMDIHNNHLGIRLGLTNEPLYQTILTKIQTGTGAGASADEILWLPQEKWSNGL